MSIDRLVLDHGKYTIEFGTESGTNRDNNWVFRALRYGKDWLDLSGLAGASAILSMAYELLTYRCSGCVGLCKLCHAPLYEYHSSGNTDTDRPVARRDGKIAHDASGFLWCQPCQDEFDRSTSDGRR